MTPTILVIEDNEQNLYLVTYILEKHGYAVAAVRDGKTALEAAQAVRPALILLDIQLPVMDGYAVARALRTNPALRSVPIVAITSYAMIGDREQVLAAGCTEYMEKPINPETFMAELQRYLPPLSDPRGD